MKITGAVISLLLIAFTARGIIVVYPDPGLAAAGTAAQESTFWRVDVVQSGVTNNSFAYWVAAQKLDTNPHTNTTWTTYSASGIHTVNVTKLYAGSVSAANVYPSSYGITASVSNGTNISFTMPDPGTGKYCAVICDDDWSHPLLVFADPLETSVPTRGDPNVIYFSAPGVYTLSSPCVGVASGMTLYIAGGAYVRGRLQCNDTTGVTIRGRGILSGELFLKIEDTSINSPMVSHLQATNFIAEGITTIQAPAYHYRTSAQSTNNLLEHLKLISWYYSTDGMNLPPFSTIQDCFFKNNDDQVKLYFKNSTIQRCVFWGMEDSAIFITRGVPSSGLVTNVSVLDCDIIKTEATDDQTTRGPFVIYSESGSQNRFDHTFDGIRIENSKLRLFQARTFNDTVSVHDFTYKNIFATNSTFTLPNLITGFDAAHPIYNFTFGPDFWINGTNVASSTNLFIQSNTSNIVFTP